MDLYGPYIPRTVSTVGIRKTKYRIASGMYLKPMSRRIAITKFLILAITLSLVAFTHLRTIFIKGHVAHIVHSVFDFPVSSI